MMIKLTLHDRCDRCIQQAYVRTTDPEGRTLDFCGSHWRRVANHVPDTWLLHSELARLEAEHGPNRVRPAAHA